VPKRTKKFNFRGRQTNEGGRISARIWVGERRGYMLWGAIQVILSCELRWRACGFITSCEMADLGVATVAGILRDKIRFVAFFQIGTLGFILITVASCPSAMTQWAIQPPSKGRGTKTPP
jgi:hypothetical protein